VLFSGDEKFTVTTLDDADAEEMATAFGPNTAGAVVTVAEVDAAVNPHMESTPTILYVIVWLPDTGGVVTVGALGVLCDVAAPAFCKHIPAPLVK
jgi:hypothetical protein